MKIRTLLMGVALSGLSFLAGAGSACAAVLVSQPPTGDRVISQQFPDAPAYSTYAFDDFTLLQSQALTLLQVSGFEEGAPSQNVAVTAQIWTGLPDSGALLMSFSGTEDSAGTLTFMLGGFQLDPGTYWLTAFVTRPSPFAGDEQWFINLSTPITGTQAYLYNPGGALLGTSSPVPMADVILNGPEDLAFVLSGDPVQTGQVPEPESLLLFGAAAAAMAILRRRRAA